jgi:hypothetical protein
LVGLGSAFAGFAQFSQVPAHEVPTAWQVAGMAATALVFVGCCYLAITEVNASAELEYARAAVDEARTWETIAEEFGEYEGDLVRSSELYNAVKDMRDVIELTMLKGGSAEAEALTAMVETAGRSLSVAFGFQQEDRWTICIYRTEVTGGGGKELVCVAHKRAIDSKLADARRWPAGVGVAGVALANSREVTVPDMMAPHLGNLFALGSHAKDYDADRYKSIVAVPIRCGEMADVWGVVVATNDKANHFGANQDMSIEHTEPARALALMAGLAVKACQLTAA